MSLNPLFYLIIALIFVFVGCQRQSSDLNYADIVLSPAEALPSCAITELDNPAAGLRPFAYFTAKPELLNSAIRSIQEDIELGPIYEQILTKPSLDKFAQNLKIPKEELAILYTYTKIGDTYYNTALRKGGKLYERWRDAILGVVSTLNKISSRYQFKGEVFRYENVSDAELNLIKDRAKPGTVFGEFGFLSSTRNKNLALQAGYSKAERSQSKPYLVIYRIHSNTGIDMAPFSHFRDEAETLFLPSSVFRVKKAEIKIVIDMDYLEITLDEV